jgi:hypothetical protein
MQVVDGVSKTMTARDERLAAEAGTSAAGRRRWLAVAGWLAGTLIGLAVYLRLAETRAVNSDGASQALQAWDILHGNLLLHGWVMADASIYTTEIPEYMLIELVHGLGQGVVHIGAAITYTLAVLCAALLAKGQATGREAAIRVTLAAGIMLAPQLASGTNLLLSSPDHIGTSVPVMLAWLLLDRARPRWWVPVLISVLLAWTMIADEVVLVMGVLPLIAVCAVRLARALPSRWRGGAWHTVSGWSALVREQWYPLSLAAGAAAAGVVGLVVPPLIYRLGGFYVKPVASGLSPLHLIVKHNAALVGQGFLLLGGADFIGVPAGASKWFIVLHLVGVLLAVCAVLVTAWRFFRADFLSQVLLAAIVINVVAYLLGTHVTDIANTREMAPVLPFAAALTGRQLARFLTWRDLRGRITISLLAVALAGYVAGLGLELTTSAVPPQQAQLTTWLEKHPLGTGLSGYWESNVVTLTSGGRVAIRVVHASGDHMSHYEANNYNVAWYDPATARANFVAFGPALAGYPGFTDEQAAIATFGKPARTYHVGDYTIFWWPKNLLATLPEGNAPPPP